MTSTIRIGIAVAACLALGCAGGETQPETRAPVVTSGAAAPVSAERPPGAGDGEVAASRGAMDSCPMMVPDVSVVATDVGGGAALTWTTGSDEHVDELRARVDRMASMMRARAERPGGGRGMGGGMAQGGARMPPAQADVVEIDGGARLELRARDPGDVDALREGVRARAERMRAGTCPMMEGAATSQG